MRQVNAEFVQSLLSQEQKEPRLSTLLELHDRANSDGVFFSRSLIIRDESSVYGYDPETKMQNSHRNRYEQGNTSIKIKCESYADCFLRY